MIYKLCWSLKAALSHLLQWVMLVGGKVWVCYHLSFIPTPLSALLCTAHNVMNHPILLAWNNAGLVNLVGRKLTFWRWAGKGLFRRHQGRHMTKLRDGVPSFKPLLPSPQAPIHEHVPAGWIQHPVVSLPWFPLLSRNLHKALIQRQVVADGVLPALLSVFSVVGKIVSDELADFRESESLGGRAFNCHCYQSDVRVRRLWRLSPLLRVHFYRSCLHSMVGTNAKRLPVDKSRNRRAGGSNRRRMQRRVVDERCPGSWRHTNDWLLAFHRWRWVGDERIRRTLQWIILRWPFSWGWYRQRAACSSSVILVSSAHKVRRDLLSFPYTFGHNRCRKAATCRGYLQWLSGMPCG